VGDRGLSRSLPPLEQALLASGERVLRVAPKLMGVSLRGEREPGKSDPIDAGAIARAVLREGVERLPGAFLDGSAVEIRLLCDHRDVLVNERTRLINRLRITAILIGQTAGAERFESDAHFARMAGVAPVPVSSGRQDRHRLDRGGNRQLNRALHIIAITRGRLDPETRAYLQRKEAEGKSRMEAMRCLKRHLARRYHRLLLRANSPWREKAGARTRSASMCWTRCLPDDLS
jgi:transposase